MVMIVIVTMTMTVSVPMRMSRPRRTSPFAGGGALQYAPLPGAEEQAERDGEEHEEQTVVPERHAARLEGPAEGGDADHHRGDEAEDAPEHAGFARDVAAQDDAEADRDHREIPEQRKKQSERFRAMGQLQQGMNSENDEECPGQQGAVG